MAWFCRNPHESEVFGAVFPRKFASLTNWENRLKNRPAGISAEANRLTGRLTGSQPEQTGSEAGPAGIQPENLCSFLTCLDFVSVNFSVDPCVFVGVCLSWYHSTTTTTTRSPTTSPRSSRLTLRPQVRVHHQHHRYNLIWYNLHLVNPSAFRVPYLSGVAHLVFAKHCALALESDSV